MMERTSPKRKLQILGQGKFSEVDESDPYAAIVELKERISFLEEILNNINATLYVNDLLKPESVWGNKMAAETFGATIEEINEGGFSWHEEHYHPNDFEVIANSIKSLRDDSIEKYNGIYRARKTREDRWHTHYSSGKIFRKNEKGENWLVLVVSIDVTDQIDNRDQLEAILKENLYLCNKLKINELSKREKEILGMIGQGMTVKAIAEELKISPHTVDTHRKNMSRKLRVNNMAGLAAFAVENGLN